MTNETWQTTVEAGDVRSVTARVRAGSGEVRVAGGAETLFDGTFDYAVPEWQPEVTYEMQGDVGELVVQPPRVSWLGLSNPRYVWDLRMGGGVPIALTVELGSGRASLSADGLRLSNLNAKVGSGEVTADLSGRNPDLEEVTLVSASGRLGLILNGQFEKLRTLDLKNASGVTNVTLGGEATALERVRLKGASGNINLGAAGHLPKLRRLDVKVASGVVDLNLSEAAWETMDVSVDCVSGKAVVRYPADVGVFVRLSSVTGSLDAPGLAKVAGGYATANYEEAERKLNLSMSTVSGKLVLQPRDA